MPSPYIKTVSQKYNIPMMKLEYYWNQAKDNSNYPKRSDKYWSTVMKIFKSKLKKYHKIEEQN